jgi:hypothetical protein
MSALSYPLNGLNALHTLNRRRDLALAGALFVYVLAMRTFDVATTFLMLGEQARDWTIALGGITDLPLVGAPSTAGGRGFGPAYYWLLWLGRVTIGPFMDNLPHAGGVIVALLQSIGDVWLFLALSRRIHWGLALATCLLIASGPFDIAISSVIWNPPVAAALIKMATASALMLESSSPAWRIAATAALAWMAVQTHLSALFVAAPLLLGVAARLAWSDDQPHASSLPRSSRQGRLARGVGIIAAVIFVLQIPFLISLVSEPAAPAGPGAAIASITSGQSFRPFFGLNTVTGVTGNLFLPMAESFQFWIPFVIAGAIVLIAYRRDAVVIGASVGGIATASLVFATWTRSYDGYWFLPMIPALALTFAMAVAAIPWKPAVTWIGIALLLLIASWQPARIEDSKRFFEYPQYETMVRASRDIVMRAPVVRDITLTFEVHPTMDRYFVYTILGGRIDPGALYTAIVKADGSVVVEP